MNNYNIVSECFGKALKLVQFLEIQSTVLEEKVIHIKNISNENNIYEDFFTTLTQIKKHCKSLKYKLSVLAFDLSSEDDSFTEILDKVYLDQNRLNEIERELFNKNILLRELWKK